MKHAFLLCVALLLAFCHVSVCRHTLLQRKRVAARNGFSMAMRLTPAEILEKMSPYGAGRLRAFTEHAQSASAPAASTDRSAPTPATPSTPKKVVIVGSGPVGLYTAIKMALTGSFRVTLCEKYPTPSRARFIGLFDSEVQFLKENNIMPVSVEAGTFFPAGKEAKKGILVADLEEALRSKAQKAGVVFQDEVRAVGFKETVESGDKKFELTIQKKDGTSESLPFDYLVYAAGSRRSEGESSFAWHFQQTTILKIPNKPISFRELARKYISEEMKSQGKVFNDDYATGLLEKPIFVKSGSSSDAEDIGSTTAWAKNHISSLSKLFSKMLTEDEAPVYANELSCFVASLNPNYFKSYDSTLRGKRAEAIEKALLDWILLDLKKHAAERADEVARIHFEGPLPSFFGVLRSKLAEGLNNQREERKGQEVPDTWYNTVVVDFAILEFLIEIVNQHSKSTDSRLVLDRAKYLEENPVDKGGFATEGQRPVSMFGLGFTASQHVTSEFDSVGQRLFIVGDALTEPWYRFGLGVHDGWYVADAIVDCLKAPNGDCLKFEEIETMRRERSIQILYSALASFQHFAPQRATKEEGNAVLSLWDNLLESLLDSQDIPTHEKQVLSAAVHDSDYQFDVAMRICEALYFRSLWMQKYTKIVDTEEERVTKAKKEAARLFMDNDDEKLFGGKTAATFCQDILRDLPFFDTEGNALKTHHRIRGTNGPRPEGLKPIQTNNFLMGM